MRKLFLIATVAVLVPYASFAYLDYIELAVTGVVSGELDTATSADAIDGKILAVHVENTSSGTFTNAITLSTVDDTGVSLAAYDILTLASNKIANAIYPVVMDAVDETGATRMALISTNDDSAVLAVVPFYLLRDKLKLSVTNGAAATTNNVTVRVVIEN